MPTQLQFRRGTTAQTASFTGGVAEVTVDTDKNTIVVHDGVTAGGWPAPQLSYVQGSFDKANTANNLAQAAFNYANTIVSDTQIDPYARVTANAGFDKANTANVTAQASFDTANTKFASSGGTISGNVSVTGNITPTTGNTYSLGAPGNVWKSIYVGPGSVHIDGIVLSNTNGSLTIAGASDISIPSSGAPSTTVVSETANLAFNQANAAFGVANSSSNVAQGAFNQANTANTTASSGLEIAQAAFNNSNTKFNTSGGTITGNVSITGNLVVSGNFSTVNTSIIQVSDSMIALAVNNVSDIVDIGFYGHYANANSVNVHTGLVRDAGDKIYYLFDELFGEPGDTIVIANASIATINANVVSQSVNINGYNILNYATSAFNQANLANVTAQAGFNVANTDVTNISISAGSYGNTTTIPTVTVEANGRVSAISVNSFTAGAAINDDTTTNIDYYPIFATANTGTPSTIYVSSTKLLYRPSTGQLTVVDLNTTSDVRYKENVKPIESAINTLNKIEGVSFNWKETGSKSYGVIAQELEKVLPELVHGTERGMSVSYLPLIAILIEAVKEQQKQIDELKKQ